LEHPKVCKREWVGLNASGILRIALILEFIILLGNAVVICRDYQDSWILEGLEIPFTLFVATFLIYIFREEKVGRLLPFALAFRAIFFLIPSLKYPWFQGVAIDQQQHYGLMQDIYNEGHIRSGELFASAFEYSGTPFMHLTLVEYSRITSILPLDAFKFLPYTIWLAYPVLTLILVKRIFPISRDHPIAKYTLILSSIPYIEATSYIVMGQTIGLFLVFLFLSQFAQTLHLNDRRYWVLTLIFSFVLIGSHSFSSWSLLIGLLITYVIYLVAKRRLPIDLHHLNAKLLVFLAISNVAWLLFNAQNLFDKALDIVLIFIDSVLGKTMNLPVLTGLYPRFFELGFLDELKIILLYYGPIIFLLPLMLAGVVIVFKKFRHSKPLMFLSLYAVSLWLFLGCQMALSVFKAGLLEYIRIPVHTLVLSPIFCSMLLYQVKRVSRRTKVTVIVISLIMTLSIVELFNPPQLVPSANTVVKGLPSDIPIVYVNNINSVYQRYMIKHAERYIERGMIACDAITKNQIAGMTNYTFSTGRVLYYYYPLSRLLDKSIIKQEYDYFLIHSPGKSGSFQEKAEIRTPALIAASIQNCSLVYNNGESYITTKPFLGFP
jgi:hypothetical protein